MTSGDSRPAVQGFRSQEIEAPGRSEENGSDNFSLIVSGIADKEEFSGIARYRGRLVDFQDEETEQGK